MNRIATYFRSIYRNRRQHIDKPRYLTFLVTYRCNARCIMCDCWKKPKGKELDPYEIENIFQQLPKMDMVRISGGEPFLRTDLPEIVRIIKRSLKPLFLHITTNGLSTERIVRLCLERETDLPLHLLFSIDGLKDKHNTIRGIPNAWEKVMATLDKLSPWQKKKNFKIAVNQTIVDAEGVEHHRPLKNHLKPYGIPVHAVMAYDSSAIYNLKKNVRLTPLKKGDFNPYGNFSDCQLKILLEEVKRELKNQPFLQRWAKHYYWNGVYNRLLNGIGNPNPPCVALTSHLRILPDGQVPTCQFNSITVGDLNRKSFDSIWNGEKIKKQRQWVHSCPGCWAECEVLPNAVYSGDLFLNWKPLKIS